MSNKFEWDDDDFRDIPAEVNSEFSPPVSVPTVRSAPSKPVAKVVPPLREEQHEDTEQYSDGQEDYEEDETDTEDYTSILSDARLRLEQGRLYEMIMNHNLFDGLDSDPKAVKNVQKEIREFAKERMEVMLGMRQEVSKDSGTFTSPFNSLEVEALKDLAYMATKGASKSAEAEAEEYVAPPPARRAGLNSIRPNAPVKREKPKSRPLQNKPKTPIKREINVDPNLEARIRDEGVEQVYIEEAKRQLAAGRDKPLDKPISQMSDDELREYNKLAASRAGRQVKSNQALPQPSPEQTEAMIMNRVASATANAGPSFQTLLDLVVRAQPKK